MSKRYPGGILGRCLVLAAVLAVGQLLAAPVGPDDAVGVAAAWLRSGGSRVASGNSVSAAPKDFLGGDGQRLAYIVDLAPKGFVVVPADDTVEPILFYSPGGKFDGGSGGENILADMLRRDIPSRLAAVSRGASGSTAPARWSALRAVAKGQAPSRALDMLTVNVDSFVTTTWNQGDESAPYTYDYYTPNHYVSGCVATAMAQIVRYYQYPSSVSVNNTVYVDGAPQTANWSGNLVYANMPGSISDSSPDAQRSAVGALIYACGIGVGMSYASGGSGAVTAEVANVLVNDFGYVSASWKDSAQSDWPSVLQADLNGQHPAQMSIRGAAGGHSIVCDGWGMEGPDARYHLNMGWGGSSDGWYQVPNFNAGYQWDTMGGFVYNVRANNNPRLNFLTQPSGASVGATISPAVQVEALNADGSRNTGFNGNITLSFLNNPTSATLGGTLTRAAVSGVASFNDLTVDVAGTPYSLQAVATGYSTAASNTFTITAAPVAAPFRDDFSTDRGWIGYAAGGWMRGAAVSSSYDPSDDHSPTADAKLLGYNIGGNYGDNMAETAVISPPINCSGLSRVTLSYWYWLTIESSAYDHALVKVSPDAATWTTVDQHTAGTQTSSSWQYKELDISSVAAGQPRVYVAFVMGTTDGSINYGGWSLDDVYVGGGPTLIPSSNSLSVPEGGTNTFTVRLSEQPSADVTATVTRASGDADLSVNAGGTLTFTTTNWATPQTVTLAAAEDADMTNGSAIFTISAPTCVSGSVTATESDNDANRILVSTGNITVAEGGTQTFGVSLSSAPPASVTVNVTRTSGDASLSGIAGTTLLFTTSNWATPQTVTIRAAEDPDAINGTAVFTAAATGWTAATVNATEAENDVLLVVSSTNITAPEGSFGSFTVALAGQPAANVAVTLARISGDGNLTGSVSGLTFTPSNWSTPQTVQIRDAEDVDAANGTALFRLTAAGYPSVDINATEADNDIKIITSAASISVPEGATRTFTLKLGGQPSVNTTVTLARISGDADLWGSGGTTLVFTPSNWNTPQTVTIKANEDADGNNGVAIFRASSSGWTPVDVTATEVDNDWLILASPGAVTVPESGMNEIQVSLNRQPATNVVVSMNRVSGDASLRGIGGLTMTFTPSNWNVAQTATIEDMEDTDAINGAALFRFTATNWVQADVTATEADNDYRIVLAAPSLVVPEGATQQIGVTLAGQPAGNQVVRVTRVSGDASLAGIAGTALTFTPSNWNVVQYATVFAAEDADAINGSALFRFSSPGYPYVDVTLTEADNDQSILSTAPRITVPETGTAQVGIYLAAQPATDVKVSLSRAGGDASLIGIAGIGLTFTPFNWNVPQYVTIYAAADNDAFNGTATFSATAPGWNAANVDAVEADLSAVPSGVSMAPVPSGG